MRGFRIIDAVAAAHAERGSGNEVGKPGLALSGCVTAKTSVFPKQMRLSRFSGDKVGKLGIGLMGLLFEVHR